jgi:predicted GNAT family acetyltransferase
MTSEDVEKSLASFQRPNWHAFLGRIAGQAAGIAVYGEPLGGISEIAGIATRPAFRRRGIAAFLTAHALQAAFQQGTKIACLTAADERAGRVYERVGFRPFSIMLAYIDNSG